MAYNGRAPQDRATAQLLLVMGTLVTLGGVAAMIWLPLDGVSRLGIPTWLLFPAVIVFGAAIVWTGVRMWRRGRSAPK